MNRTSAILVASVAAALARGGELFFNPLTQSNGVYRPWMTVDVRDDADCHVGLLESVHMKNGERYIAWSTDTRNVKDICADIDRLLPELGHDTLQVTDSHPDRIKAREAEFAPSGPAATCATTASRR